LVAQKENLLPTILSRCTILNFQPISYQEIEKELLKKGIPSEKAKFLAYLSSGQIGRVLKDSSFLENWEQNLDFLLELSSSDLKTKMDFAKIHAESGQLKDLTSWFLILRDALFLKINPSLLSYYPPIYLEKLSSFAKGYKTEQIFSLLRELQKTENLSLTNINQRLLLENFILKL
jgi:DNA polymerase-3 subunit delta'